MWFRNELSSLAEVSLYRQNSRLDNELTHSESSVACSSCSVPHDKDIKIQYYLPSQSPSPSTSPPCLFLPCSPSSPPPPLLLSSASIFFTSFPYVVFLLVCWTTTVLSGLKSVKKGHGCSDACHFVLQDHLVCYTMHVKRHYIPKMFR
jgi:hypothetical protein